MNLPYSHDGSTRKWWVLEILEELNKKEFKNSDILSDSILKVIENLLDIKYFSMHFNKHSKDFFAEPEEIAIDNFVVAIEEVNKVLVHSQLEAKLIYETLKVEIIKTGSIVVSTAKESLTSKERIEFTPSVFKIPNKPVNKRLISVMMPFSHSFTPTYKTIQNVVTMD